MRATKKLMVVVPIAVCIIFLALYLQFKSTVTSILVFSGMPVPMVTVFVVPVLYCWVKELEGLEACVH